MACGNCFQNMAHGAKGLAKAALHINRADEATIRVRRATCRQCSEAKRCFHDALKFCTCKVCGCLLVSKTANADESCPLKKW